MSRPAACLLLFLTSLTCPAQNDSGAVRLPPVREVLTASIVPAAFIAYGTWCISDRGLPSSYEVKRFRDKHFGSFRNHTDDYLLYTNAILVYGFDLLKAPAENDLLNQTIIMAKTTLLSLGITGVIKYGIAQQRPDGSNNLSFPSGHSALAFALAGVLHREFKKTSPWIGVLGYTTATATAAMRVLNNKHWYSDVLAGAGIGMLSTRLVYLTHQNKYKGSLLKNSACLPIIGTGFYGLSWQKKF